MRLSEIQQLFARDVVKLLKEMEDKGFKYTLGEAYRTPEQAISYAKQGKGIVNSQHCSKLAVDINLFDDQGIYLQNTQDHEPFGKYWESLSPSNRWGGKFKNKDGNHYERYQKPAIDK